MTRLLSIHFEKMQTYDWSNTANLLRRGGVEVRLGVRPCLLQGEGEGLASFVLGETV